ncbi:uncharacterized protein si:dkey-250d21.1 isoform X2 [Syngnathus typhle]|uniref:uncharacterized protein si:dkey-250d21.1 isoform X2 n=1 Tax=Syngnathus typhle TaxID=161592 RepID=UPI002A6AB13F|nr:uncharacterized protein si:dkey-250d21.1 isoform X2 [Syngnathus typhle]
MTNCCAAANCDYQQEGPDSSIPLFSFPSDPERCQKWLTNCCRQDLASQPPEELHNLYKVCAKHFEPSLISDQKILLSDDAVPTIFDFAAPTNDDSTCNRKRAGGPVEEEPTVKKTKENIAATKVTEETKEISGDEIATLEVKDNQAQEIVSGFKAKETLKAYFKEILALTGFSINGGNINTDESTGGGRDQLALKKICVEKIDKKEILQFSESLMREEIQNTLRHARFFSILLQNVTSIEGREQIPIFIRSVTEAGFPQKHLVGFLPCDLDADSLFHHLLSELRIKWGLRMEHCRGLSYLVSGRMCQPLRDLTCKILLEFPQVVLSPSDPYAFNIWIIRCMPVPTIQSIVDTVEEVASLLRSTPELYKRLEGKIQMTYGHIKGEVDRIKAIISANWECGTDAFQSMLEILEPFLNCINEMISKVDEDTAEQMAKLKPVLKNFNFIMTLVVLKNTLCCVSILNSSLKGIISMSSTLQYTISNALKLVNKYQQDIAIFNRKWFSDAVSRAKKLGVEVIKPEIEHGDSNDTPLEDFYRETLARPILQYLVAEVKRIFSTEMVRILRWLSLVPSYMADHNFSIRRDKVADANLNNLARPDTFYEELGCWEVKWRHASKRRILPTTVFATLKIPDIAFYPNVQSLLRVLGTVPCVNAEADVYGQYHMVLERCHAYLKDTPEDQRQCSSAYVYVNQDVHFNVEQMVDTYVQKHPDILKMLQTDEESQDKPSKVASQGNHADKDIEAELQLINMEMDAESLVEMKCAETDREALRSALQATVTAAYNSQSWQQNEDKEAKSLVRNTDNMEVATSIKMEIDEPEIQQCPDVREEQQHVKPVDENGQIGDNRQSLVTIFRQAAILGKKNTSFTELSEAEKEDFIQDLNMCHWFRKENKWALSMSEAEIVTLLIEGIREVLLKEIQESPFFSLITDKPVKIAEETHLPVFVRYVRESAPKVELMGYLPYDVNCDVDTQARKLAKILTESWGLPMAHCRGQAFMHLGSGYQSLKKMSLDILESYPLCVVTPSESRGLAHWLVGSVPCSSVAKMLDITEDLLLFFDESPRLEEQLAQAVDGLLNVPREALEEIPETFCSRWKKREDFFDILADTLEGVLSCLDAVCSDARGAVAMHAQVLSAALKNVDFIVTLVIVKNACAPLRNCSTIFRCGNPADILCEVEKIPLIVESLSKMSENVSTLHATWFEQAYRLANKVAPHQICFSEEASSSDSPEVYYRESLTIPLLKSLIDEMKYTFSENHLKALSILSLLPSCNPQPILPESTDKPFNFYLSDLPEPDTLEQDVNAWAAVWGDKDQDVAPPTSIAETLVHAECKNHPTIILLLRLVAVLPSVSIECDLMKSTLNSMRDILRNTVCKGNRTARVMLLSHNTTLQRLPEVIAKCIEVDPESSPCLSQVMETIRGLNLDKGDDTEDLLNQALPIVPNATSEASEKPADGEEKSTEAEVVAKTVQGPRQPVSFYEPLLREEIIKELWDSQFFTIITEQTVDIDGEVYVPLCIRYLNKQDIQSEETLAFIPFIEDSAVLLEAIETTLSEKWGLNMAYCRGQSLLSVGKVGTQMRAVSLAIANKYPQAVRTLSYSLSLNVWLAKSSANEEVADRTVLIDKILHWLTQDVERQNKLEEMILHVFQNNEGKGNELRDMLMKNWEKSHDMHEVMAEILEAVLLCLSELKHQGSVSDQQQAWQFFDSIRNFDFILSLVVLRHVLHQSKKLSQSLQGKPLDMLLSVNSLPDLKASLRNLRSDIDTHHEAWFEEAVSLASKLHIPLLHSVLLEPLSEFYKNALSMKFVEHAISEIDNLFTEKVMDTFRCLEIVPYAMSKVETSTLSGLVLRMYKEDLPDEASLQDEMKLWKEKWLDPLAGYLPTTVLDTLKTSQIRSFSNIETLLRLQVILPFSRRESNFKQGKKSLQEFMQQEKRSLTELHPL